MRSIRSLVSILLIFGILISSNGVGSTTRGNSDVSPKLCCVDASGILDLLVIAPSEFEKELQPLIAHKNSVGIRSILVSTEKVYDEMFWYGRDDAEKVKYFIKSAIEEWNITYVLLMGGRKDQGSVESWWVPVRYSHLERRYGNYPESRFLSDLYFADIYDAYGDFSSWDTDNDGVFSEWEENSIAQDVADLHPDVYVGRIPCRTKRDVRIAVDKIIGYETQDFSDTWFKTMVVVAGDTYAKTDYNDGEVYTQTALGYMTGFSAVRLWTSDGSLKNSWDTVQAMNKGCGFIFFSGHGNPASWATHPPGDESVWIDGMKLRHMPFLINSGHLPVCITGSGCFNSMFNVSLLHHPFSVYPILRCWSEAMVLHPHGGSIATIGSTAFSYESSDISSKRGGIEWLDIHFFEQYGTKDVDVLGKAWGNTVSSFLDSFPIDWSDTSVDGDAIIVKNVQQWLLMGDPSLKIGGYQ
jgi:hypothetical protein